MVEEVGRFVQVVTPYTNVEFKATGVIPGLIFVHICPLTDTAEAFLNSTLNSFPIFTAVVVVKVNLN
jgi:hypothetical protein